MSGVAWQPWSQASFERAARERKPIYVNVAAGWCHWCHVMDATTLADPVIRRLLEDRFVAIRVDADARPDLAERYQDWGWPANAFLTPEAAPVQELRGYQEAAPFRALLESLVDQAAQGRLEARQDAPPPPPDVGPFDAMRDRVQARLDSFQDQEQGGWGVPQKYPFPAPVEQAFLRARLRGEPGAFAAALHALEGTRRLLDPVWGGVFQYSVGGTWADPHFEKIAAVQAGALESFTQAWQWTDDPAWAREALAVRDYVLRFLRRPDGAFATSQDADATGSDGRPVPGARFYALDDAGRRRAGAPRTDTSAYADWNGLLIHAFARHAQATGDPTSLQAALQAADRIWATHAAPGGALRHGAGPAALLHLRDNAAMGRAALALHQATGAPVWLARAEGLARFLLGPLQDARGGFLAHTPDPAARGIFAQPRRPLEDNGLAIRFLVDLSHLSRDAGVAEAARRAAGAAGRALADPAVVDPEAQIIGQFLLGLEALAGDALVLVAAGEGPLAERLAQAALRCPIPMRLVRRAGLDEAYPREPAALYLCRGTACSPPVRDAAALPAAVARALRT